MVCFEVFDTGGLLGKVGGDLSCAIGRSVIPQDEFVVFINLREDGYDRFFEILLSVINGHDEGHFRVHSRGVRSRFEGAFRVALI